MFDTTEILVIMRQAQSRDFACTTTFFVVQGQGAADPQMMCHCIAFERKYKKPLSNKQWVLLL